jgi:hypothetical protein
MDGRAGVQFNDGRRARDGCDTSQSTEYPAASTNIPEASCSSI